MSSINVLIGNAYSTKVCFVQAVSPLASVGFRVSNQVVQLGSRSGYRRFSRMAGACEDFSRAQFSCCVAVSGHSMSHGQGLSVKSTVKQRPSRCLIVIEVRLVRFPKKDLRWQAGFDREEL